MCTISKLADQMSAYFDDVFNALKNPAYNATKEDFYKILADLKSEAERQASGAVGRNPGFMYFEGLNNADKPEDEREDTIDITVTKGDNVIIKFTVDYTMQWIVQNGMRVYQITRGKADAKHFKDNLRMAIRKLAEQEEKEPGSFVKTVYPQTYTRERKKPTPMIDQNLAVPADKQDEEEAPIKQDEEEAPMVESAKTVKPTGVKTRKAK